jgi:hypothetical protein
MNLKIRNFIQDYNFNTFSSFLSKYGWLNVGKYNEVFTIWHKDSFEIIVPETKHITSFPSTINRLIVDLADYYQKPAQQIIDAYNNSIHDKIKYQVKSDDTKNGLIPLNEGIKLLDNTKEMLAASFLSMDKKKKYYFGPHPESVNDVLNAIELGQTEEGSFVINIFIPRDYYEGGEQPLFEEPSMTRKALSVIETASNSLFTSITAYQQQGDIKIFDNTVIDGVSANFCQAISEISANGKNDVEISIEYNNGIDKPLDIHTISVKKEYIPVVNKVAEYLRSEITEENTSLYGYITTLHREKDAEVGEITLATWVLDKQRKVRMDLNQEQYTIAGVAHEKRQMVVCEGTLWIKDRTAKLLNVSSILIEAEETENE